MVYESRLYGYSVTGYSGSGEFSLVNSQVQMHLQLIHRVNSVVIAAVL